MCDRNPTFIQVLVPDFICTVNVLYYNYTLAFSMVANYKLENSWRYQLVEPRGWRVGRDLIGV